MNDRTPTKVLPNGAIRYGVYDEAGNFLRYEYIKPEDMPTQEGTPFCKEAILKDATAAKYGKGTEATPDEIFQEIFKSVCPPDFHIPAFVLGQTDYYSFNYQITEPINISPDFQKVIFRANRTLTLEKSSSYSNGAGFKLGYTSSPEIGYYNSIYIDNNFMFTLSGTEFIGYTYSPDNRKVFTVPTQVQSYNLTLQPTDIIGHSETCFFVFAKASSVNFILKVNKSNWTVSRSSDQQAESPFRFHIIKNAASIGSAIFISSFDESSKNSFIYKINEDFSVIEVAKESSTSNIFRIVSVDEKSKTVFVQNNLKSTLVRYNYETANKLSEVSSYLTTSSDIFHYKNGLLKNKNYFVNPITGVGNILLKSFGCSNTGYIENAIRGDVTTYPNQVIPVSVGYKPFDDLNITWTINQSSKTCVGIPYDYNGRVLKSWSI